MPKNTKFPKKTFRTDPYENFRFKLEWDGKAVSGFSNVAGLSRTTNVITHRSSDAQNSPRYLADQSSYEAITLERGITYDVDFEQWANEVWDFKNSTADDDQKGDKNKDVSLKDFRQDLTLNVFNEAGQKVLAYKIYRCWPSGFTATPEMDGNGNAVAIQSLRLENEGWERDDAVK
ncbi:MAG: phage tail protein [Litorimonas sp.]